MWTGHNTASTRIWKLNKRKKDIFRVFFFISFVNTLYNTHDSIVSKNVNNMHTISFLLACPEQVMYYRWKVKMYTRSF